MQVEHLGGDAVVIPNGVHVPFFAEGPPLPGYARGQGGPTIGFLGRYAEPRKGLPVLLEAMRTVVRDHPGPGCWWPGGATRRSSPSWWGRSWPARDAAGRAAEAEKAAFLRSVDVYCAPNLLGESFGVVLLEAMAAGAPVVASDLDAFARVLEDGTAGVLVPRGSAAALAGALTRPAGATPPAGPSWPRRAAAPWPGTTGRSWPTASSPSTRRSPRPAAVGSWPPTRTTPPCWARRTPPVGRCHDGGPFRRRVRR